MNGVNEKKKTGKVGIVTTLTLIFLVLKLLKIIDWPWIWVFCPVWISGITAIFVFTAILIAGRIKKGRW